MLKNAYCHAYKYGLFDEQSLHNKLNKKDTACKYFGGLNPSATHQGRRRRGHVAPVLRISGDNRIKIILVTENGKDNLIYMQMLLMTQCLAESSK